LPTRNQLHIIRAWLPLVVVTTGICALIAGVLAMQVGPTYVSEVRLLSGPSLTGTIDNGDIIAGQNLAPTYAELATTRQVLERAIAATGAKMSVEDLQQAITTHVPVSSGLISLQVQASDPNLASDLANAIAAELKNYPASSSGSKTASNVTLTIIDPAVPADHPQGPRVLFTTAIGAAIGLVLSLSFAFVVESLRRRDPETGVIRGHDVLGGFGDRAPGAGSRLRT
jgi:capsular polysaccharide biosynthesis protein